MHSLTFTYPLFEGTAHELVPMIDGRSLVDHVGQFERLAGLDVPGKYAGLVLDYFNFGDLTRYLMGDTASSYSHNRTALLGCDCGEWGCWPLLADVRVSRGQVHWSGFRQPFRPERDYSSFGPFTFNEHAYRRAVAAAANLVATTRLAD